MIQPTPVSEWDPPRKYTFVLQVPCRVAHRTITTLGWNYSSNTFINARDSFYYSDHPSLKTRSLHLLFSKKSLPKEQYCMPRQMVIPQDLLILWSQPRWRFLLVHIYVLEAEAPTISFLEWSPGYYKLCKKGFILTAAMHTKNHECQHIPKMYQPFKKIFRSMRQRKCRCSSSKESTNENATQMRPSRSYFPPWGACTSKELFPPSRMPFYLQGLDKSSWATLLEVLFPSSRNRSRNYFSS